MVIGAVCALLLVAVGVGALLLNRRATSAPDALPPRVLIVFALPGEDNATTAQLIVSVDTASGRYQLVDTTSTVVIAGTPYTSLRDAYPFGGAKAVAAALADASGAQEPGWVDVSFDAWKRLLVTGVDVTLPEGFDTFDDVTERYSEFLAGPQHISAEDVRGLVNGLPYLDGAARSSVASELASASIGSLVSTEPTAGIETNLGPEQWAALMRSLRDR
jgi:hypothetical protein